MDFLPHILKQLNEDLKETNIQKQSEDLKSLIQTLINVANSLASSRIPIKQFEMYSEPLIHKMVFHSTSLSNLVKGNILTIESQSVKIIDIPSCYVLTRAILETYVTFHYIYVSPKTEEERFFRFKLWELSGLISRQNVSALSEESLKLKAEEKELIEKLKLILEEDPFYSELSRDQKRRLNNIGLPRINSWAELIEMSDLSETFINAYKHFSQYAHSEFISAMQIKTSNYTYSDDGTPTNIDARLTISICKVLISKITLDITELFPIAKIVFNASSTVIISKINSLSIVGKKK